MKPFNNDINNAYHGFITFIAFGGQLHLTWIEYEPDSVACWSPVVNVCLRRDNLVPAAAEAEPLSLGFFTICWATGFILPPLR